MIHIDKCCFCLPLRTWCLILGYLHLIGSIIQAVVIIMSLPPISSLADIEGKLGIEHKDVNGAIAISLINLQIVLFFFAFAIVLVVGLHKEYRGHVKAYLIYYLMFLLLYTIMYVVSLATQALDWGYTIGTSLQILLGVYFLLVVHSHWVNTAAGNLHGNKPATFHP
ncbi:uncharacterized protein LOC128198853 [Bicyclus anynana]|uniref:Uncharacterized protein LOC128198853 n=1 Tax=Bicyclus anynana TaxID=110368 RepID=A0ABM3LT05_BICAN|nr:uncharacterized protein LOC128198853 [Bicyclus anynana]